MKRHAVIISFAAIHSDSDILAFLKIARPFVFKIRRELKAASGDVATVFPGTQHCRRPDINRSPEFVCRV